MKTRKRSPIRVQI